MPELKRFDTYEVGGCVRDRLLGREPKDIDYSCEFSESALLPDIDTCLAWLEDDLADAGYEVFVTTREFFTVKARDPATRQVFDFVLARKDGPYSDGRRPDWVVPATLHDDLARRDFTVNAIAIDGDLIIDPFDGQTDIKRKRLRTVGEPYDRFIEDALRVVRAVRFSITHDFTLDPVIIRTMWEPDIIGAVRNISKDRRREELEKAFRHDTLRTMAALFSLFPPMLEAIMADIQLRPTFTFKGEA